MALWSMGANQSVEGVAINRALLNLCVVTGQIGRPGAGPLSLTGQPNAMGGRETGGLAHLLPGYRKVVRSDHRAEVEAHWGLPAGTIAAKPGLPATDLFEALEDGRVKAVWIVGTNPAVSMPDASRAREALRRAELVIAQDAYHPTETTALAHVVLPAAQWPEKAGTMVNSERRITLMRAAIDPPGEARADWQIFAAAASRMGFDGFKWSTAEEVYDEFAALTAGRPCDQAGVVPRAARARGDDPVAVPLGVGPRDGAAVRRRPLPHARRAARVDPGAARRSGRPAGRGLPARAHHRPDREPVAHDDAHGQVVGADGGGARAVHRAASGGRAARVGRRPRPCRLASGNGRSQGSPRRDAARGHGLRAVPLGRAARPGRRGRRQRPHAPRDRSRVAPARA